MMKETSWKTGNDARRSEGERKKIIITVIIKENKYLRSRKFLHVHKEMFARKYFVRGPTSSKLFTTFFVYKNVNCIHNFSLNAIMLLKHHI